MPDRFVTRHPTLKLTPRTVRFLTLSVGSTVERLRSDGPIPPDLLELLEELRHLDADLHRTKDTLQNGTAQRSKTEQPVTIATMTSAQVSDRLDVDRHTVTRAGPLRDRLGGRQGPTGRWSFPVDRVEAEARNRDR